MNIQWYPGHMTKTRRMMEENISLVDIVCELVDARLPLSSKNPDIDRLAANKKRVVILNKADLADPQKTKLWQEYFKQKGFYVITADSKKGEGIKELYPACRLLMKEKIERLKAKGRILVPSRVMIAGIPNVGKSTLINKILGKNMTKVGDKPGVTRSKQWVKIKKDLELLDTPGILWPKFDDREVGLRLAFTGAVNDDILDIPELAAEFISRIITLYPDCLKSRYSIDAEGTPNDILLQIGKARSFLTKGGEVDILRTSTILLDEFRGGKLGRITLEAPPEE